MDTTLFLIRHCQATGQEPGAPLTPDGEKQAEQLSSVLGEVGIKRIIASPFMRAIQSIEPLARRLRLVIETDARLQERVLSASQLPHWRESLRQTFDDFDLRFPGGESSQEARQRASLVVQHILHEERPGATAIVSHGNLSALLLTYFDNTPGFSTWEQMTTPDVFRIEITAAGARITHLWHPDIQ